MYIYMVTKVEGYTCVYIYIYTHIYTYIYTYTGLCTQSCLTLLPPHELKPTKFPCPWNFPGKNTGVDCHFLLQYKYIHIYIYISIYALQYKIKNLKIM